MTKWIAMTCTRCNTNYSVLAEELKAHPVQICDFNGCGGVLKELPPYQDPTLEEGCRYERAFGDGSDIG